MDNNIILHDIYHPSLFHMFSPCVVSNTAAQRSVRAEMSVSLLIKSHYWKTLTYVSAVLSYRLLTSAIFAALIHKVSTSQQNLTQICRLLFA